jgi:DNA-binding transcriptional MocR family regulator
MRKKPLGAVVPMIAVHRKGEKPLHRQIYDAFRAMILEHRLQPGQQIPSTRTLADDLGISRIPVSDRKISARAEQEGLWLWPLSAAYAGTNGRQGFILGFGGTKADEMLHHVRRPRKAMRN